MGRRWFGFLFLALSLVPTAYAFAADAQPLRKVRMAFTSLSSVMCPPWIARELGIFNKHGLDVEVIATPTGVEGMNALDRRRTAVSANLRRHHGQRGIGRRRCHGRWYHPRCSRAKSDGAPGD